jgi:DNA polymerase III epsilon subunit-like protein
MSEYDFVCVDVETTGLDDKKCEVIEVTAAEYNLNGQVGRIISKLCRPVAGFIPAEASAINHITWEMVKDSPNYLSDGVREEIAEFIGTRTATGHNIISFDSRFLKIKLDKVVDTLNECRKRFSGSNKLKTACLKNNIDWDDKAAHRSEYDVLQTIKLHCKINILDEKEKARRAELPLFSADAHVKDIMSQESKLIKELVDIDESNTIKLGILPSENDRKMLATQSYSYSRVNLFNQCPFKWYMQYIKGFKEPNKNYFQTGKICHKVAEWAGEWCYKKTFKNKLSEFLKVTNFRLSEDVIKLTKQEIKSVDDFCEFIYNNFNMICVCLPPMKNVADLIYTIDHTIKEDSYDHPSMPDLETYNKMVEAAISYYKCEDADVIIESRSIMNRFYSMKDFSIMPGELILMEKKLVFDREWKPLDDFNSPKAFFRGIIDLISYLNYYVIITDYKSSRKMMSVKELQEDHQTMTYVLLICKFLPKGSFKKIIVRVDYIRFGQTVEYEISDPEEVANRALEWINSSIQEIEKEMLKTDGTSFNPTRNEYCHTCFLGEEGVCPLFNKQISGKLDDPFACAVSTIEECRAAWKRIETNTAENTRLTSLCKSFVKKCEDPIKIDENAKLDFWAKKYREYDTRNTVLLLLNKKFEMTDFINYFGISASNLSTFLEEKGVVLTQEELNSISREKTKMMFDAFTSDEAKGKGFINA